MPTSPSTKKKSKGAAEISDADADFEPGIVESEDEEIPDVMPQELKDLLVKEGVPITTLRVQSQKAQEQTPLVTPFNANDPAQQSILNTCQNSIVKMGEIHKTVRNPQLITLFGFAGQSKLAPSYRRTACETLIISVERALRDRGMMFDLSEVKQSFEFLILRGSGFDVRERKKDKVKVARKLKKQPIDVEHLQIPVKRHAGPSRAQLNSAHDPQRTSLYDGRARTAGYDAQERNNSILWRPRDHQQEHAQQPQVQPGRKGEQPPRTSEIQIQRTPREPATQPVHTAAPSAEIQPQAPRPPPTSSSSLAPAPQPSSSGITFAPANRKAVQPQLCDSCNRSHIPGLCSDDEVSVLLTLLTVGIAAIV